MQVRISKGVKAPRWAWTDGLRLYGQTEVAVSLPWPEGDARDGQVKELLRFLEKYVGEQHTRILPAQTMRYGWTMLRFREDVQNESGQGTGTLLVEELRDPFKFGELVYVPGASRALQLVAVQQAVMRRNRIVGESEHPHRSKRVMVCGRIRPESIGVLRPLRVERVWESDSMRCGWLIACVDPDHDHENVDELEEAHLHHLVERFPGLFPYLALPGGTLLLFTEDQVLVFGPGEQDGRPDPSPLLAKLP
jgi:hypothetical protein